jgi:hypothetical protein
MKSWKTTLVGALSAAGLVVLQLVQTGTVDVKTLAIAAGVALIGFFAKDSNVTGGNDSNNQIPEAK